MSKKQKYWYSWKGTYKLPIPIAPQGWYNFLIAAVVALGAALIFLPLDSGPSSAQMTRFLIIAIPDALIFTFLTIHKKEPRPPRK